MKSVRGRVRVFTLTQLPFISGIAFIVAITAIAQPSVLLTWPVLLGIALAAAATIASLAVPWERHAPSWMIIVAVSDIISVAFLSAELLTVVPAVTILAIFPIWWLAYGFPWFGSVIAVFGAGFITSFRFVYAGAWPSTALEWANVVALPTFTIGMAIVAWAAARNLRRKSWKLEKAHRARATALDEAQNAESIALGILNAVNAGVAFYDNQGRLDIANGIAHQLAGSVGIRLDRPPYAGEGVLAADRVTPIPPDEQILPRALRGEKIDNHLEWVGPPESQVALLTSSDQVFRQDGRFLGTVIVAYDVTELMEALEVREQFLRTVSHELRTPITGITGFLDLIDDAIPPEDTRLRRYLEVVTRRTNDLLDRVSDLLAANDSHKTLCVTDFDLRAVVDDAVLRVAPLAERRSSPIEIVGPDHLPARGDRGHLTTAIAELLTNASKFGTPHGLITLAFEARGDRLTIAVTNDGHGITHVEQRRVFDRFYRTSYARAHEIQGFGLGLTDVRAIVAAHQGQIRIDSEADGRTTITLDLPAADMHGFGPQPTPETDSDPAHGPGHTAPLPPAL
ncbi:PAS domain-containing sensor histidine kinase [Microbacterium sp.]|uniref:sensor histidine kinase n=1 Tax=Microbacterium sp. TaxID=51671 RepID=UPI0026007A7A|nr:PAS domain-containing sensor histidine kinase [Microbacterium sp.]